MTAENDEELQMTFWEHLNELRGRLVKGLVAVMIGGLTAWFFRHEILEWLVQPYVLGWNTAIPGQAPQLHFTEPHAAFVGYLKLSIMAGCIFALPVLFYQVWAFIAPGLYSKERRLALPFVFSSTSLFLAGGYFGWRIAFPLTFEYLLGVGGNVGDTINIQATVTMTSYLELVSRMLLAFGAVFEIPVVVFFLSVARLINHTHLIKFGRYFIVVSFLLAAIITPPDVISQLMLAVPLCTLYLLSIGIAWLVYKSQGAPDSA